jgi:adenine C2-methylase RlmN of 23S rRNA A2503 and tRNA A37
MSVRFNDICKTLSGEPSFRTKQIREALYNKKVTDWSQISTLPQPLKEKIRSHLESSITWPSSVLTLKPSTIRNSTQATKVLFELKDGQKIESVYMKFLNNKTSLCISSQGMSQ